jgi:hypothetical protein
VRKPIFKVSFGRNLIRIPNQEELLDCWEIEAGTPGT